jgi:hypothetical protein
VSLGHRINAALSRLLELPRATERLPEGIAGAQVVGTEEIDGDLGDGFAECHHRLPFSQLKGATDTRLEDLAILCANCHRVLHRRRGWGLSVEQLRAHLEHRGQPTSSASLDRLPQKGQVTVAGRDGMEPGLKVIRGVPVPTGGRLLVGGSGPEVLSERVMGLEPTTFTLAKYMPTDSQSA